MFPSYRTTLRCSVLTFGFLIVLSRCCKCIGSAEVIENAERLYFSLMVSGAAGQNTSGVVPAVERALQDINNDSSVLPGYSLHFTRVTDTQCNSTRAEDLFIRNSQSNKTVLAVVGCGCSSATEAVARNSIMPVISYASTSVVLRDRSVYRSFFRTVPSDELLPAALATTMNYYGWKRLAIITEDEQQYEELLQALQAELSRHNIAAHNIASRSTVNLTIIDPQHHIFFLNTRPNMAMQYLCKAYQYLRHYPNYLWIVPGWYSDNWWREFPDYLTTLNCTLTQVEQVLNRSLTFLPVPRHLNSTTAAVITTLLNPSSYAADAVRALALALNESLNTSNCNESLKQCIQNNLTDLLIPVEFVGKSGIISFDTVGNRPASGVILQQYIQKGDGLGKSSVAFTNSDMKFVYIPGEDNSTTWPCGVPPDGTPIKTITVVQLPARLYSTLLLLTGIVAAITCLLFNIIFRKQRIVKLTSPNLNYVIVLGAAVQLSSLLIYVHPDFPFEARRALCRISLTLSSLGHDMIFSIALLKSWRVVYIFRKPSPCKKPPPDWKLLLSACALASVDLLLYCGLQIPGTVVGTVTFRPDLENQPRLNEQGVTELFCVFRCSVNEFLIVWAILAAIFKIIIHMAAIILAFLTRKVKVDALNDYKYNFVLIHISTVLNVLLVAAIFGLGSRQNVAAFSFSTIIFLDSFFFLVLTFVPKMVALYKDPKGKHIFGKPTAATVASCSTNNGTHVVKHPDKVTKSAPLPLEFETIEVKLYLE